MDDLQLELPTGALIAGDAAALFADARPLVDGLPTGCFPARATDAGLEVRLTEAEPVEWTELGELPIPSGYAALLDASALAGYTDLGDEPVDEFELLSERFTAGSVDGGEAAAGFHGVLAVRATSQAAVARLRLGLDETGAVCRIWLRC